MGSIQTRQELPDRKNFNILDYGYCRVWKRKLDSLELMEEYQLCIESEERLKCFENVWPLRTNSGLFVNVYYFSHQKSGNFCGEVARGSLFTERICYRLSEFANIKYPEILMILRKCIQGYNILYQNFGLFFIRSTMIGFTQNFQLKIWFHTDFSQPEPENPNCKTLQEMFTSIINSVESACQYLYYHCPRFSQFVAQTNYAYFSKDFKHLLKGLQEYAKKLNITMPMNLINLKSCFKQPEGWQKFKVTKNYPKLIVSQTQIELQNKNQSQIKQIPQSKFLKKEVFEPPILNTPLKKTFSTSSFKEPNDRVFFKNFEKQHSKVMTSTSSSNPSFLTKEAQISVRNQVKGSQEIKFWRSSDKINADQFSRNQTLTASPNLSRFHSPPQKFALKVQSNEYYGSNLPNLKRLSNSNKRSSQNQNDKFGRNSIDSSADTRNRDKSVKSEISLIEDLEFEEKDHTGFKVVRRQ